MRGWEPPTIERGIPIPPAPKPRNYKKKRVYHPSPWIEFLKGLSNGDTFRCWFSQHVTIEKYLKQLGIIYEYRWMGRGEGGRFWILDQPHVPEYKHAGEGI